MDEPTTSGAAARPPDERPAKVKIPAAQLDESRAIFSERLEGLSDHEYLWEPVPGSLSLRAPGEVRTGRALGGGELVLEVDRRDAERPSLRTIAWLVCHLVEMQLRRHDYTLGTHSLGVDDLRWPATAAAAIIALDQAHARWRSVFDLVPAAEFDLIGRSRYPEGLDPGLPLAEILWWMNREYIHHTAEIAMLRDLYAWRDAR